MPISHLGTMLFFYGFSVVDLRVISEGQQPVKAKQVLNAHVTLGLGHSTSKPKGSFVCYTGCLPCVSMPSIGTQLVRQLDFSKVLNSNLNHCATVDLDVVQ